jgi:hypothetical protein
VAERDEAMDIIDEGFWDEAPILEQLPDGRLAGKPQITPPMFSSYEVGTIVLCGPRSDTPGMSNMDFEILPNGYFRTIITTVPWPPPPAAARWLLELAIGGVREDALIGDINERFTRDCEEVGLLRARLRYWGQVGRSVGPLLLGALRRMMQ